MTSRFAHYPTEPEELVLARAHAILVGAHRSCSSLLDAFDAVDAGKRRDEADDLLRASLLLAAAGLDSMTKQLVHDALPHVIARRPGSRANLREFVDRRLRRGDPDSSRLLAAALTSPNPAAALVDELIRELTGSSLQSTEALSRVAAFFDIPSSQIIPDVGTLNSVFIARNQIAHEMDVDFTQPEGHRRSRQREEILQMVTELLRISGLFLASVNRALKMPVEDDAEKFQLPENK